MMKNGMTRNGVDLVRLSRAKVKKIVEGIAQFPWNPLKSWPIAPHPRQAEIDSYAAMPAVFKEIKDGKLDVITITAGNFESGKAQAGPAAAERANGKAARLRGGSKRGRKRSVQIRK